MSILSVKIPHIFSRVFKIFSTQFNIFVWNCVVLWNWQKISLDFVIFFANSTLKC